MIAAEAVRHDEAARCSTARVAMTKKPMYHSQLKRKRLCPNIPSSSINATAKVEGFNIDTGEYRIVLQGTLDKEESKFDEI